MKNQLLLVYLELAIGILREKKLFSIQLYMYADFHLYSCGAQKKKNEPTVVCQKKKERTMKFGVLLRTASVLQVTEINGGRKHRKERTNN